MSECYDCGIDTEKLFKDFKSPPLAEENCLCADCAIGHIDEQQEEMQIEIDEMDAAREEMEKYARHP